MASSIKKKAGTTAEKAGKALQAAAAVKTAESGRADLEGTKIVSIRLDEFDHRRLKSLFAGEGVKLATGIKTAALWIAEMAESGAVKVSKAGIIDRRG
jgi:hypothetical protein